MSQRLIGGVVLVVCGLGLGGIGCETGMDAMMAPGSEETEAVQPAGEPAPPGPLESPEPPEPPTLPAPPEPSAFGVWRMTAGSILVDLDPYESHFLILNEDGTGQWTLRHVATNALLRIDLLHVLKDGSLQIAYLGLGSGVGAEYTVVLDDSETMRLAGRESTPPGLVEGRIATFAREAELPDGFRTRSLQVLRRFDGLSKPVKTNDLVSDGTSLFYQTPDEEFGASQRIDPDTGAVLETFTSFAGAQHTQTMQDGGFWTHCGCGSVNDARLTDGPVSDTFDTEDLGDAIQIRAMAFDPIGRVV